MLNTCAESALVRSRSSMSIRTADRAQCVPCERAGRGVTKDGRTKATKPAVTREQVYVFAIGAIAEGYPKAVAAAVICFEWLQRPENVLAGLIRWTDYRGREAPTTIRITHHKTNAVVRHPLEETIVGENSQLERVKFYTDAEFSTRQVAASWAPDDSTRDAPKD
jgi:hypothetical protein